MPPLPTVSKCGAQCHWLRTKPHNNGTDKSAKAGQNAERGNASHTRNHQGHTHWDHEVHANYKPPTNANQTENGAYFSAIENPHNPLHEAVKDTKWCRLQVCQLTSQTNQGVGKVPKPIPASLRDTPARKPGKALPRMASRQNRVRDQASHSRKQQTVRPHSVHWWLNH